jgi:hypothetical protein
MHHFDAEAGVRPHFKKKRAYCKIIVNSILRRDPMHSKKVSSIEEVDVLSNKMDAILAYINKQNVENVPLYELVGNNAESVDVNFVRNFGNNGYGNNYNSYNRPPYVPNKYTTSSNVSSDL